MDRSMQVSSFGQADMSRLEDFLNRMEDGQSYGSQGDIDMLLEEIVKRLERRVIAAVDRLQPHAIQQGGNNSSPTSGSVVRKNTTERPDLDSNTGYNDVQDLVGLVVRSSMDRITDGALNQTQHDTYQSFRPSPVASKVKKGDGRTPDRNPRQGTQRATTQAMTSLMLDEDDAWRRTEVDDTWIAPSHSTKSSAEGMATTARQVERSSMTRPATSSGHGGLYVIKEQKKRMKPKSAPAPERRATTPASNPGNRRNIPDKRNGEKTIHDVSTNYTFSLRRSVGGAIPKYLQHDGSQSKGAMMHMFNVIRTAMADDSIECMVADFLGVNTTSTPRPKGITGNEDTEPEMSRKAAPKAVAPADARNYGKQPRSDGGRAYLENRGRSTGGQSDMSGQYGLERMSSNTMDEPYVYERGYVRKTPQIATTHAQSQNMQRSYVDKERHANSHENAPGSISRLVQKGSPKDAMFTMADNINMEKGGWRRQEFDDSYGNEPIDSSAVMTSSTTRSTRRQQGILKNQKVDFAYDAINTPSEKRASAKPPVGDDASMRYDSSMAFSVRRRLRHAIPKFTQKNLSGALLLLSEKLMDEYPLHAGSALMSNVDNEQSKKETSRTINETSTSEVMPWVTKGKCASNNANPSTKGTPCVTAMKGKPVNSAGKATQNSAWVSKGENVTTSKKNYSDSSYDSPWVTKGKAVNRNTAPDIPGSYEQSKASVCTQTSRRALYDEYAIYPQTVTAGRGWNKNSNQSASTVSLCSENSGVEQDTEADDIFYDALTTHAALHIKPEGNTQSCDNMSFLKRFRLNLLFRKKKPEKKFVSAVHKVIEARRSGCIDEDGQFVQSIAEPKPLTNDSELTKGEFTKDGQKSPPPKTKPKPKLDKNGNQRVSNSSSKKQRGSNRRRHHNNPDRNSYPLPEEDDGSEGYASASEMDDFNPTAFLERNRRSAENRYYNNRDDAGDDADVESDSDGNNSSNRRVRFSDDVQHFGEIDGSDTPEETGSSDNNLDQQFLADDSSPDISLMSLKSKIELFEKVSSNEFLDDRSYAGSPPPADLPVPDEGAALLPTKDRVKLFEDITNGKAPTTCSATNKIPRRAVESCQYTLTQSKISFFEQLSDPSKHH